MLYNNFLFQKKKLVLIKGGEKNGFSTLEPNVLVRTRSTKRFKDMIKNVVISSKAIRTMELQM